MQNLNSRVLVVVGSLVALNAGLFVFNNLPLVPVRERPIQQKVARQARDVAKEAREMARVARSQAKEARKEARAAVRQAQKGMGVNKRGFDQLSQLDQLNDLRIPDLRIEVPEMPAMTIVAPETPVPATPVASGQCSRRITLHQYLRDHMM